MPAAYAQNFSFIDWPARQLYAAKVKYIDDALGQVLQRLRANVRVMGRMTQGGQGVGPPHPTPVDQGMWNNTLFILTADNGGPIYDNGSAGANNWPLKASPCATVVTLPVVSTNVACCRAARRATGRVACAVTASSLEASCPRRGGAS